MDARATTTTASSNPPSVEIAYKRKCIALKKRLAEVEAENELMRTRNRRGWQYIQKMRLESCLLLERLAQVTGMTEDAQAGADPELRARAAAMMSSAAGLNGLAAQGATGGYLEDETEGSSDEQPPTPEERPLRVKRSRKSNINLEAGAEDEPPTQDPAQESGDRDAALPRLAPAPSQQELTSSFRVHSGSNGSVQEGDQTPAPANGEKEGREQSQVEGSNEGTTPMDMDTKEPKVEA